MNNRLLLITTKSATETEMVCDLLRKNGIPSYPETDAVSEGLEALVGSAPYGSYVYVDPEDFQKAKGLVDAYFEYDGQVESGDS